MPRKDRRFTGEDVARLYCRNLAAPQKEICRVMMAECAGSAISEQAIAVVLRLLADGAEVGSVPLLPTLLDALADVVEHPDNYLIENLIDDMGLVGEPTS